MAAGSARLVLTDPPCNCGVDYGRGAAADRREPAAYLVWCEEWLGQCARLLADDGTLLVMIDGTYSDQFGVTLRRLGLHRRNTIVWHETFGTYTPKNFTACARFIHYYTRHATRYVFHPEPVTVPSDRQTKYGDRRADPAGKVRGNVWSVPRLVDNAAERVPGFPTQPPLDLVEPLVLFASDPGDLVLDPFNGSGPTGAAAVRHGRRYVGIDESADAVAASRSRLQLVTAAADAGAAAKPREAARA